MGSHLDYYVVCCKLHNRHEYNTKYAKPNFCNCTKWDLQNVSALFLSRYTLNDYVTHQHINPYPTAFPYGNGMVLHFYQQQESSTTKTVHKVINKGLKTYV